MEAKDFYDTLGEDYDRMVSWEGRLAREDAFFRGLFDEHGVRRVLDAACGTGMHAIAFARQGRSAEGADLSPVMVDHARRNAAAAGVTVTFTVAGFGDLAARLGGPFDAVTCLGNSLPHLPDDASLDAAFRDFARALRPGGLLVIQNRNYDRVLRERSRFMPVAARTDDEGETLFLRITDFPGPIASAPASGATAADARSEESIAFTIVTLKKRAGSWSQSTRTTPLRALRRATLERAARDAGFTDVRLFGSYDRAAFDAPGTGDLILTATR
ncbi:MAG TPA: class I SAM-dependent methyltransferase [Spirochaetia bacterium]|nr:class I SAM-dependent methyltransferase [Spirochaetia bacterium]